MISAGLVAEANAAVDELGAAIDAVGVPLPLSVDPHVWDCAERGPVRLLELGSILPEMAVKLAAIIRNGAVGS